MKYFQLSFALLSYRGAHIGHKHWHLNMQEYLTGSRNFLTIMDLTYTILLLRRASNVINHISKKGGRIIFITDFRDNKLNDAFQMDELGKKLYLFDSTTNKETTKNITKYFQKRYHLPIHYELAKRRLKIQINIQSMFKIYQPTSAMWFYFNNIGKEIQPLIKNQMQQKAHKKNFWTKELLINSLSHFCVSKWIGGLLSNYKELYTHFLAPTRIKQRLTTKLKTFPRFLDMLTYFPFAVFTVNGNVNLHVIKEARKIQIPSMGLMDSDNIRACDYPIPCNDDSAQLNWLLIYYLLNTNYNYFYSKNKLLIEWKTLLIQNKERRFLQLKKKNKFQTFLKKVIEKHIIKKNLNDQT